MIETWWQLLLILLAANLLTVPASWFAGFHFFLWYIFYRVRKSTKVFDLSNRNQITIIITQLTTHPDDFDKMYYLNDEQIRVLKEANYVGYYDPAKCFPHIGKDLSEYTMQRPPLT